VDVFAAGLVRLIASLWCLWDPDKQCGWDKVMSSYVAYSPTGDPARRPQPQAADVGTADRLRELQRLREEGLITAEEYEQRRQRLVDQL
jgi:hypothetical protein